MSWLDDIGYSLGRARSEAGDLATEALAAERRAREGAVRTVQEAARDVAAAPGALAERVQNAAAGAVEDTRSTIQRFADTAKTIAIVGAVVIGIYLVVSLIAVVLVLWKGPQVLGALAPIFAPAAAAAGAGG